MKNKCREMAEEILQEYTNCYSEGDQECLEKMLYKLTSDVAEEIFAEIESKKIFLKDLAGNIGIFVRLKDIAELKKKYIGKDINVTTKESEKDNGN